MKRPIPEKLIFILTFHLILFLSDKTDDTLTFTCASMYKNFGKTLFRWILLRSIFTLSKCPQDTFGSNCSGQNLPNTKFSFTNMKQQNTRCVTLYMNVGLLIFFKWFACRLSNIIKSLEKIRRHQLSRALSHSILFDCSVVIALAWKTFYLAPPKCWQRSYLLFVGFKDASR